MIGKSITWARIKHEHLGIRHEQTKRKNKVLYWEKKLSNNVQISLKNNSYSSKPWLTPTSVPQGTAQLQARTDDS